MTPGTEEGRPGRWTWVLGPRRQGESWLYWQYDTPPASCPASPTSGCAVTSEAGLGPVAIWAGGRPRVQQEGVALAQRLQLLALTQRGPRAVLGTQRGLGRCRAGTHTHTERDRLLAGEGAAGPGK